MTKKPDSPITFRPNKKVREYLETQENVSKAINDALTAFANMQPCPTCKGREFIKREEKK